MAYPRGSVLRTCYFGRLSYFGFHMILSHGVIFNTIFPQNSIRIFVAQIPRFMKRVIAVMKTRDS